MHAQFSPTTIPPMCAKVMASKKRSYDAAFKLKVV